MVSSRVIFIFVTLFVAMLMTISSAPVVDDESVTSEPEDKSFQDMVPTQNETEQTTDVPDVITDKLLYFDATAMPLDENIKTGNFLLFEKPGDLPQYPPTEDTQLFQMSMPTDTVANQN
jgi:hypothetical protein